MRALLISTYELGRQPFGLASPAAWLREAGVRVDCLDLAVESLDEEQVANADVVGLYLPMHTATRIAQSLLPRLRKLNPDARLCAWGLYAPIAEPELRELGVEFLAGGEFERDLRDYLTGLAGPGTRVSHERLDFRTPDRRGLPSLERYARLRLPDGSERLVGATEASRGCKHLCRHCPIVPVYDGRFRIVPPAVVLADVEALVASGAEHVTFGDPDFLNGPRHAERVVRELARRFPDISYDVTIKVEHLLAHRSILPVLVETGCILVTSAVESIDDRVLEIFDKGHTADDFGRAVALCREAGLDLQPTFVPFHPWTSLDGYRRLLETIQELDLVGAVSPIQLAIRLLIPRDSRLLELEEEQCRLGAYDPALLGYVWEHEDPRVDELQREIERIIERAEADELDRARSFERVWQAACEALGASGEGGLGSAELSQPLPARATIPYLTEPWYC